MLTAVVLITLALIGVSTALLLAFRKYSLNLAGVAGSKIDGYGFVKFFNSHRKKNAEKVQGHTTSLELDSKEKKEFGQVAGTFYDLATDFYISGWGTQFHFAPRAPDESLNESLARYEYYLASAIGMGPGKKVADFGCGIGGPAQNMARFSGCKEMTCINVSDYQLGIAKKWAQKNKMDHVVRFHKGDYMNLHDLPSETYDAVFSMEATPHASDRTQCYREAFRLLKPGCVFGLYEWAMTDKYDPTNKEHQDIRYKICIGDGLPDVLTTEQLKQCMKDAGFELLRAEDLSGPEYRAQYPIPWYNEFVRPLSIKKFGRTAIGRSLTRMLLQALEATRLAPAGTVEFHAALMQGADGLSKGGLLDIFTPNYLMIGRKPLQASQQ